TLSYQWLRGNSSIRGATGPHHTLTPSDRGSRISVRVTGSQSGFDPVSATAAPTARVAAGVLTAGIPTLSGTVKVGKKVTVSPGTWGPAPVTLSYQWLRDGAEIRGATKASYTPVRADGNRELYVVVTGSKTGYENATASPV